METVVLKEDVILRHDNGTSYFAAFAGQEVTVEEARSLGVLGDAPAGEAEEPEPAKPARGRPKKDGDA